MENKNYERVQKLIAKAGLTSRRHAEKLIEAGKVYINDQKAILGTKASWKDKIVVNDILIASPDQKVYYVINKPEKVITSLSDPEQRQIISDFLPKNPRVFPVGRLDYNTTGTLLLTNDGELAFRLMHPKYQVERIYRAKLDKLLTKKELAFLNSDQVKVNQKVSKQEVEQTGPKSYTIKIALGSYHHIKKLFALVDKNVLNLKRLQYANITHQGLKYGEFRKLNIKEIRNLKILVKMI